MSRKTGPLSEESVMRLKRTGAPASTSGAGSEALSSAGSRKALRVRDRPQGNSQQKAPASSARQRYGANISEAVAAGEPQGDRKGPSIGINLTQSSSTFVGARVVRSGGEGLYGRPRPVPCAYM